MHIKKIVYFLLITLLFSFCTSDKKQNNKNNIFSLNIENAKYLDIDAIDLVKEIEYIPIKEQENTYIKRIEKLEIKGDRIFIKPKNQSIIFIFSDKGELIDKINNIGEGPLQFSNLLDFTVDNNYLYISEMGNLKILKYDLLKRQMVKEWKLNGISVKSLISYKDNIYCVTTDRDNGFIYIINDDNFSNPKKLIKNPATFNMISSPKPFSLYHDSLFINVGFTDAIYFAKKGNLVPYCAFNNSFGALNNAQLEQFQTDFFSRNLNKEEQKIIIPLGLFNIVQGYWFIVMMKPLGIYVWNKEKNRAFMIDKGKIENYSLLTDKFLIIKYIDNSDYIYTTTYLDKSFYKAAKKAMLSSNSSLKIALRKLIKKYPEGSEFENPVIVKWKMKTEVFN